jgi:5-methyltetrahydropteroyltriglutamate--homocysteine methyltransferase
MEMTKWFDTNYHYIVPEFEKGMKFRVGSARPVDMYAEAKGLGVETRPVLLGPVSFLLLGKTKAGGVERLSLLPELLAVYGEILRKLSQSGASWVQLDEPCLALDLDPAARMAFGIAYKTVENAVPELDILVATYFGALRDNLDTALRLPVSALHVDLVRAPQQIDLVLAKIPAERSISLGLVDGRNIWKTDLSKALGILKKAVDRLGPDRVMVGPSCSLLHCPVDLSAETELDDELRGWLAFSRQKLYEIVLLARAINDGETAVRAEFEQNGGALGRRAASPKIHNERVATRLRGVSPGMLHRRSAYAERRKVQHEALGLPLFPTTTIGSFPQTKEVRAARSEFKSGKRTREEYDGFLKNEIKKTIEFQEEVGIDVFVHGESERSDMVEYFGERLSGFAFTKNGWVQSYGSRCVKPPIIYGDVERPSPMTVEWSAYAQSLTRRPVKGMLTGPVTILQWSFVRDDQPRALTCRQVALAIRDEVLDLEKAGIKVIQIDEPAMREGLPLRRDEWQTYLKWAVEAFRLASSGVRDETQIHTHMCYSEFNEIIGAIADMDADVISIEASRSQMELLKAFKDFEYPNEIGPGVYDIHSPRVPTRDEIIELLKKAVEVLAPAQLWVNPDCGLKTRRWEEVRPALAAVVAAAKEMRLIHKSAP